MNFGNFWAHLQIPVFVVKQKPIKTLGCAAGSTSLILSHRSSSVRASSTALARQLRIAYGLQLFQAKT